MPAIAVNPPFPLFTDADGQPLDDAYIYIGTANQNPVSNPITVYWDAALTITAAQPIRTSGGYPVYNGTPARFYTNNDYSILLRDKNGSFIYTATSETDFISSEFVTFVQSGTGAVATTVQAKLRETVSVKDFGAVGDGVTDDTAAIQNAINAVNAAGGGVVYVPTTSSYYKISTALVLYSKIHLVGAGYASRIHSTNTTRLNAIIATGTSGAHLSSGAVKNLRLTATTVWTAGVSSATTGSGVYLIYCDEWEISGNYISGWSDAGVSVTDSNRNKISKNHVQDIAQGLQVFSQNQDSTGNVLNENTIGNTGLYDGIIIEGGAVAGVGRGYGNVVAGNTINNTRERGITSNLSYNTVVNGNSVMGAGVGATSSNMGILMFGSTGSSVTGNVIDRSNGYGIVIGANSGDSIVSGNTTTNNVGGACLITDQGISAVTNVSVQSNRFVEGNIVTSGNVTFLNTCRNLKFQNVAVSDSTTLDWYEENTFTPTVQGATTAGTATYSVQTGRFTRLGNRVLFEVNLGWSSHTGTGQMRIANLPYAINGGVPGSVSIRAVNITPGSGNLLQGFLPQGGVSYVQFDLLAQSTGVLSTFTVPASGFIVVSGQYAV